MAIPMVDGWPHPRIRINFGGCVSNKSEVTALINGKHPKGFKWGGEDQFNGSLSDPRDIKDALEILVARTLPTKVKWNQKNVLYGSDSQRRIAAMSYRIALKSQKVVYYCSAMKW